MPFIVKNTTLIGPLDLLFPHSCRGCGAMGKVLCECCKNNILKGRKTSKMANTYIVSDRDGLLNDIIQEYKYHSIRALARPLAELLDVTLPQTLPKNSIIVPLPTATNHIRARGLDHTYLLAKNLAKIRNYKVEKILLRNQNTVQVGADKKTRLNQAKKAYTLNPQIKIKKDATYLLLDDIYTTGASITSAKKLLKDAGAQNIKIVILARAR